MTEDILKMEQQMNAPLFFQSRLQFLSKCSSKIATRELRICRWTELAVRSRPSDQKRLEQPETAVKLFSDSVFLDFSKQAHNTSVYLKHNQAKFKRRIMLP